MDEFVETINIRERKMILIDYSHKAKCASGQISKWCAAGLVRGTILYPGTKRTVAVYPTANILGKLLELKGARANRYQGIKVKGGLVDGLEGSMPCVIENRTKSTIRLEADALIARVRVQPDRRKGVPGVSVLESIAEELENGTDEECASPLGQNIGYGAIGKENIRSDIDGANKKKNFGAEIIGATKNERLGLEIGPKRDEDNLNEFWIIK